MKNDFKSASINPDVVEQFIALLNTNCKLPEDALAMLTTLCFDMMKKCGIDSLHSLMLNGEGISIQLLERDSYGKEELNSH
ncbi:hypothetical protein A7A21_24970 (plasmid) [Escherichia coli]|uniref:hypothetical protein n=1 Tax=Escherichia coli TaxID=562 RepID=UPI00211B89E9|nr:hypothetical protein [Escherichia coli]UUN36386.1 hypothetical protein A7A21_24970 [Escherichia coli]UUN40970.1 hypothetical protein A7A20_24120 [Escherichia coli]